MSQASALDYRCVAHHDDLCLLEIELLTGRRHQIRAQLAHIGLPILGDPLYFRGSGLRSRQMSDAALAADRGLRADRAISLHAACLAFPHPVGGHEVVIKAPVPKTWERFLGSGIVEFAARSTAEF